MRDDFDDSSGGDLTLFKFSGEKKIDAKRGFSVDPSNATREKTITYKKNTLIMFLNGIDSLHAVTPRYRTKFFRKFLYLSGTLNAPMYESGKYQVSVFDRIKLMLLHSPNR